MYWWHYESVTSYKPTFSSHVFNPSVVNMSIKWSWATPHSSAIFSTNKNSSVRARMISGIRVFPCWLSSSGDHMIVTWYTNRSQGVPYFFNMLVYSCHSGLSTANSTLSVLPLLLAAAKEEWLQNRNCVSHISIHANIYLGCSCMCNNSISNLMVCNRRPPVCWQATADNQGQSFLRGSGLW